MSIEENYSRIKHKMMDAAKNADRFEGDISLCAVTKNQDIEKIQNALDLGMRVFGENRVQEAKDHWAEIKKNNYYPDLELHCIGPLQTNKAKDALMIFDVIQTLDREKLADICASYIEEYNLKTRFYIQVNIGMEKQKSGINPADCGDFLDYTRNDKKLNVEGLMAIPPVDEDPILYFKEMESLALRYNLSKLSMGMSDDFEQAISCGATMIRVGSALFGARE